jgi:hypothetical protein
MLYEALESLKTAVVTERRFTKVSKVLKLERSVMSFCISRSGRYNWQQLEATISLHTAF